MSPERDRSDARTRKRSESIAEELVHVGPGTLVGRLMREYWIPALMSQELVEPGGPPLRIRLLCEDLVAYRSPNGVVGLLHHACPHRGASLFFGRNEPGGLRCIYHGWQFGADGACVDMPNEPLGSKLCKQVRARAYQTRERNGIVWAYLGPKLDPPPLPELEANMLGASNSEVVFAQRECNWLQALEGDIDTSHLSFLHLGALSAKDAEPGTFSEFVLRERAPRYKITDTPSGTMYGAYRPAQRGKYYWRIAHYLFPFYTMPPVGLLGNSVLVRAWVPMDNEHTMFVMCRPKSTPGAPTDVGPFLPNASHWLGRWRLTANRDNDYLIDRINQRTISYSGMQGNYLQDQAVTESMGPIVCHAGEHLGSADSMIVRTRQRIFRAAKMLLGKGVLPPGVVDPSIYAVRSGGILLRHQDNWLAVIAAPRPGGALSSSRDRRLLGDLLANKQMADSVVELHAEIAAWGGKQTVKALIAQILPMLRPGYRARIVYVFSSRDQVQIAARSMANVLRSDPLVDAVRAEGRSAWSALHHLPNTGERPWIVEHQLTTK